jgi:predicted PurR-regulated permease PerM
VGLVLLVPLVYGAVVAVREAMALARTYMSGGAESLAAPEWLDHVPLIGAWLTEIWNSYTSQDGDGVRAAVGQSKSQVIEYGRMFGGLVLRRAITLGFTLFTLFFVYWRGVELASSVKRASLRLFGPSVEPLMVHMVQAIRATVDGIVLVALVQGAIMSAVYAGAGAPHPVLFGVLTGVFAMIPFAAPVAFGAVALLLASKGAMAAGITVFIIGAVLLFIADHFVRPLIIGEGARLPFLWVLLGILGGIESFGLVGIFLGPTLMAALSSLWRDWSAETKASEIQT